MLLIFDLDGTLFQAKPVYLYADRRLLREMGVPEPDERTILINAAQGVDAFLRNTLPADADLRVARARLLELVRDTILERGELFPGAREAVTQLHSEGHELVICSHSPEEYVETVLEHTGIISLFARYVSTEFYPSKAEFVRELIKPSRSAVVIGDTHGDIEAAHNNGLPAIAATYGYGNKAMLAAAEHFADTPMDIVKCVHERMSIIS